VIWQGPDIPCIKLCTGDTVSDVVAKLATELCTVLDTLNVTNYDLSCFNLVGCGPNDFQALIQFLIERICALQNQTPATTIDTTKTDPLVTVAPCFVVNGVTVMTVSQYAQAIGIKVCSLIDQIALLQNQITSLDARVTALEAAPAPTFTLPSFEVNCTLDDGVIVGGNTYQIDQILQALVNDSVYGYCALLSSTGLPADLLSAVATQCISNTDSSLANPSQNMSTAYFGTWVNSPVTIADAITNLWVSVCDIYNAFSALRTPTSSVTAGTGITVTTTTVGLNTNYQVATVEKPTFLVSLAPPANLNRTAPGLNTGRLCDGSIQIMTNIQYIFGFSLTDYDSATGIFTIPTTGIYTLSFWTHYTRDAGTGWYDAAVPGMFTAGIMSPTGCNFYCVNNATPVVTMKHLDITGALTTRLTAGQQICLKVINLSNYNYTTVAGDIVQMSIQRVN
jgi:hypothetical protein